MNTNTRNRMTVRTGAVLVAIIAVLSSCGSSSSTTPTAVTTPKPTSNTAGTNGTAAATTAPKNDLVLPVTTNPIHNTSTSQTLKITSVIVENNLDTTGKPASDHLEIELKNTGSTELKAFEIFYTFTDSTAGVSESYYAKLPDSFSIPAGGSRGVHFDGKGTTDHFPVNKFGLYYASLNAMDVTVIVSSTDAIPQTSKLKKDAGGAEAAD